MKFLHGLIVFLSLMLILAPPGGAVCWPLPDGRHLHIGWNDSDGEETLELTVFVHRPSQATGNYHPFSFASKVSFEVPTAFDVLPTIALGWLLPLITLAWRLPTLAVFLSFWRFPPATPPPRRATSLTAAF
jgi:hypothetical protein